MSEVVTSLPIPDLIVADLCADDGETANTVTVTLTPTPCRPGKLTSLGLAQARRQSRPEFRYDHSWPTVPLKEANSPTVGTPSTRTPSPSPQPFPGLWPPLVSAPRTRRHSRLHSKSSSEAAAVCHEEIPGLEEAFLKLCASSIGMDCRSFDKLCKEANFLDAKFTTVEADLIFHCVMARGPRRLDAHRFDAALRLVAEKKGLPEDIIFRKVKFLADEGVVVGSTTETIPKLDPRAPGPPSARAQGKKVPALTLLETPLRQRLSQPTIASAAAALATAQHHRALTPSPGPSGMRPRSAFADVAPTLTRSVVSAPILNSLAAAVPTPARFRNFGGEAGRPGTGSAPGQAERELLLDTFNSFCWGRSDMDGRGFARLCRDCRFIDSRFTSLDVDFMFSKALTRGQRRMDIEAFEAALSQIAARKGISESSIRRAVAFCPGPLVRATQAGAVRLHDDRGGYTGTHALGGPESGALGPGTVASIWG